MKNPFKQLHSDRFIPVRSVSTPKNPMLNTLICNQAESNQTVSWINQTGNKRKQLTFSKSLSTREASVFDFMISLPASCKTSSRKNHVQNINCYKIIDVPNVIDNFYYNAIDFSRDNFVGIGLQNDLFMFRQEDNMTIPFQNRKGDSLITCLKFGIQDSVLILGEEQGLVQINDVEKAKTIRMIRHHLFRIGRIQTNEVNPSLFYTGSKDYQIHVNDLRQKKICTSKFKSHKSQICGLALKDNILASGANDGSVKIWDIRKQKVTDTFIHHRGAVKALSWCPWKTNFLVSGGGRKDQKILILDIQNKKIQKTILVNHQITDICWRNQTQELIYSYGKQNSGSIKVDNYFNPKCQNKKLTGHLGRILGLRINKKTNNILCSLGADQSLRYWNLDSSSNKMNINEIVNASFSFQ